MNFGIKELANRLASIESKGGSVLDDPDHLVNLWNALADYLKETGQFPELDNGCMHVNGYEISFNGFQHHWAASHDIVGTEYFDTMGEAVEYANDG